MQKTICEFTDVVCPICNEKRKVAASTRDRQPTTSVSQKQMTFDEIGVANIDKREDDR